MSAPTVFEILNGEFGLMLVDKTVAGYLAAWQAPGGKTAKAVRLSDYDVGAGLWKCQVTSGAITASPSTTTVTTPATFCAPEETTPSPGLTTYAIDLTFLQDPEVNPVNSLNRFLFEYDTLDAYAYLGFDGDNPPRAIGLVKLQAGTIGGAARTPLTTTITLSFSRKPDIDFGNATVDRIVTGIVAITGVTAGIPGAFAPVTATIPASLTALQADLVVGTTGTAKPTTAWTTGQYVTLGDGTRANWTGTAWAAGAHA